MKVEAVAKLVRFDDESVIGFLANAGGQYSVAITKQFGHEHDVMDIDIAEWFELPVRVVVPIGVSAFAMQDKSQGYLEEYSSSPVETLGDRKVYYGYLFDDRYIVPLNSEAAWNRMIKEAEGNE